MPEKWTYQDIPDQTGRVALVTGGNSGLGYYTCQALAAKGATVLLAARSRQRGEQAITAIRQQVPDADITFIELDLADLDQVQVCGDACNQRLDRLDLLINNAGVMAIPRAETAQGFEMQFGVNHLGHFALTGHLLPLLLTTPGSRIVHVSSGAHRAGQINFDDLQSVQSYSRFGAYAQSKLTNLLFAFELQRRLDQIGAATISVGAHPGWAATNLQAGVSKGAAVFMTPIMNILNRLFAQSAEEGTRSQLYAATAPEVNGCDYIGPTGMMDMRGEPGKVMAKETAYDAATAARLWEVSIALTGVAYPDLESEPSAA